MPEQLTFVLGCTGSGKGALGRELAAKTGGEIISADSMKVYRRMNIGTAKPTAEMLARVPHHLIDVVEPSEDYSVAQYVAAASSAIADIHARSRPIFVVGGTPLYVKALSEGLFEGPGAEPEVRARLVKIADLQGRALLYQRLQTVDPQSAQRIHPNDLRRIVRALEVYELTGTPISELQTQWDRRRKRYECVFIGLRRDRGDQSHRTNQRVRKMIDAGFVDEVRSLLSEPAPISTAARQALGYAEIIRHLQDNTPLADAIEMIKINTRKFAKAQRTWFKRFRETKWIDLTPDVNAETLADQLIHQRGSQWTASPK